MYKLQAHKHYKHIIVLSEICWKKLSLEYQVS